jgi:hypothetical protein
VRRSAGHDPRHGARAIAEAYAETCAEVETAIVFLDALRLNGL